MNPVRQFVTILALLLVTSCASQTQPKDLAVQVFERRGRVHPTSVNGQHLFLVRVTNQSGESVNIDSIEIDPQTTSLQFYENQAAVDDILEPGQTRDITMWINVNAVAMSYIYTIDSVDVVISGRTSTRGNFTERQGCIVSASQ